MESEKDNSNLEFNLKKTYSWLVKKDYSESILSTLVAKNLDLSDALKNHHITQQLRAKMVDWMI